MNGNDTGKTGDNGFEARLMRKARKLGTDV